MSVQEFIQEISLDKNGRRHVSIGQTRDGKDEWITPVTMWERDKNSGLFLPPGLLSDEDVAMPRMKVQQSGTNVLIASGANFEVAPGSASPTQASNYDYKNFT